MGRRFPVPSTSLLSLQDVLHWPLIALFPGVFGCVRVSALVCGQFMSAIIKKLFSLIKESFYFVKLFYKTTLS